MSWCSRILHSSSGIEFPLCSQDFAEDELVFKEQPLVGAQHAGNKSAALVCSHCFRFLGSIQAQISHCLAQLPGLSGAKGERSCAEPCLWMAAETRCASARMLATLQCVSSGGGGMEMLEGWQSVTRCS